MAANFFQKRPTKKRNAVINLVEDDQPTTTPTEPPAKKPNHPKHTSTNGFTQLNVNKRVSSLMTRQPKGNWRANQNSCRIPFTYVTQTWSLSGKSHSISHFSPWGMRETVARRLSKPQVKANFNVIPLEVKEHLEINKENFNKNALILTVSNNGYQAPQPFVRFYCITCQDSFLPRLLNNQKYGNVDSIEALVTIWDDAKISEDLTDVIGCFVCALDENVHMGPNKNCFFKDPTEHRKSYHPELWFADAAACSSKQLERSNLIQKLLAVDKEAPTPTLTVEKPPVPTKEATATGSQQQAVLTSKYNRKTKYQFVDQTFTKKLAVNEACDSDLKKISRGFCMSVVHTGINKCLSEAATIEMYNTSFRGIYDHYVVQEDGYKELYGTSKDVTIEAPRQATLDARSIIKYERAIFNAYKNNIDSKYSKIKASKFWGIMHDGIQKFCVEYNGMYLQSYDPDTFESLLVPFRLMKMKGGVNAHDTVDSMMIGIAEFIQIKDNAFESIRTIPGFENIQRTDIPTYFKLSVIIKVEEGEIHLQMSGKLPIANCGDGVSVNVKAARVMCELFGFLCPDFRCSSHTVDGCWKRIARSETMCVDEVKTAYDNLKPICKHFKLSSKSKEKLDDSMKVLEMGGVHLITWCATRMAHFVTACSRVDDLIVPFYYTMSTLELKKEERDKFFHAENVFTVKLVADLEVVMHHKLQRSVDKNDYIVSETYYLTKKVANQLKDTATPRCDNFVESLVEDENGNVMFTEKLHGDEHTLRLTDTHKPIRRNEDKITVIKHKTSKIKTDVLQNIRDNLDDQVSDDSYYYPWSALDLCDKQNTIEERVEKIRPLLKLFTEERVHEVQKYTDAKETKVGPFLWKEHSIFLHYPAILSCSEDELAEEMTRSWMSVARLYQKDYQETNGKPVQREVWRKFLVNPDSAMMYPNMCDLVMILLSTPANTSPLERSYTWLEMICSPRRNKIDSEHLELLYLLKALDLPVKTSAEYMDAVKLLPDM